MPFLLSRSNCIFDAITGIFDLDLAVIRASGVGLVEVFAMLASGTVVNLQEVRHQAIKYILIYTQQPYFFY